MNPTIDGDTPFEPRAVTLTGTIVLDAPIDEVFPLFSPLGETKWVDGWEPELLAPRGADWVQGMVFRTVSDGRPQIWVVSELEMQAHRVVYYRTEPDLLVARVEVRCGRLDSQRTEAAIVYSYVGLSDAGNTHIDQWTDAAYRSKMTHWETVINGYLRRVAGVS